MNFRKLIPRLIWLSLLIAGMNSCNSKNDHFVLSPKDRTQSITIITEGELRVERMTSDRIVGIAAILNPMIRGWVNYYGKFRRSMLHKVFKLLNNRIVKWARKRYKRYKTSIKRAYQWFERVKEQYPKLFYHWQVGYIW